MKVVWLPKAIANRDALIDFDISGDQACIGVYVSRPRTVHVQLLADGGPIFEREAALSPETTLSETVTLPAGLTTRMRWLLRSAT